MLTSVIAKSKQESIHRFERKQAQTLTKHFCKKAILFSTLVYLSHLMDNLLDLWKYLCYKTS